MKYTDPIHTHRPPPCPINEVTKGEHPVYVSCHPCFFFNIELSLTYGKIIKISEFL